jgi:hypothetical protein
MGINSVKDAFNAVAFPAFTASVAFHDYLRANDTEWQILTFRGTDASGSPFEIKSDRAPGRADLDAVARQTAQRMLDQRKTQHEGT